MTSRRQPARPVTILMRTHSACWPDSVTVLGEGRTLAAALKSARRALSSYEPLPGKVFVSWPVGDGIETRHEPLIRITA